MSVRRVKPWVFVACLFPLGMLVWRAFTGDLSANPIEFITHRTGDWTLRFLLIALAVTPVRRVFGWSWAAGFRRMFGLFAFFYALLHFSTYLVLDFFFAFDLILDDIVERRYVTAGFAGFVLLVPLAATSTNAMIRRLGASGGGACTGWPTRPASPGSCIICGWSGSTSGRRSPTPRCWPCSSACVCGSGSAPGSRRRGAAAARYGRASPPEPSLRTVTGITLPRAAHGNRGRGGRSLTCWPGHVDHCPNHRRRPGCPGLELQCSLPAHRRLRLRWAPDQPSRSPRRSTAQPSSRASNRPAGGPRRPKAGPRPGLRTRRPARRPGGSCPCGLRRSGGTAVGGARPGSGGVRARPVRRSARPRSCPRPGRA